MYRLYWARGTGAIAAEVMLEETGIAYERVVVDMDAGEHLQPDYLAVNPAGQLPTLELPDGTVIAESAAMVVLIGERHPETGLVPPVDAPERARFLHRLMYMATSVYPTLVRRYHADHFTTDPTGVGAVRAAALEALERQFALLDAAIEGDPWFLTRGCTALDIYLAMLTGWHPGTAGLLQRNVAIGRVCAAIEKRDAYARVMAQHHC